MDEERSLRQNFPVEHRGPHSVLTGVLIQSKQVILLVRIRSVSRAYGWLEWVMPYLSYNEYKVMQDKYFFLKQTSLAV